MAANFRCGGVVRLGLEFEGAHESCGSSLRIQRQMTRCESFVRVADGVREQPVHGLRISGDQGRNRVADAVAHAGHVIHLRGESGALSMLKPARAEAGEHQRPVRWGRTRSAHNNVGAGAFGQQGEVISELR